MRLWRWGRGGRDFEREMSEELRFHVERQAAENVAAGMAEDEARRQAALQFGGVESVKETCRSERRGHWFETFVQDVRFGLRMLRKSPGFTVVAVLTLALGIGANTAIFSVAYGILWRPLPYPDASRLVSIGGVRSYLSLPQIADIQSETHAFDKSAACTEEIVTFAGNVETRREFAAEVSGDFFSVFGMRPLLGRAIQPQDTQEKLGGDVVVLSDAVWRRNFASDRGVLGRRVQLSGQAYTIIGVMPPGFQHPWMGTGPDLWVPLLPYQERNLGREARNKQMVARLGKGATLAEANAELGTIQTRLSAEYPKTDAALHLVAVRLVGEMTGRVQATLFVLWAAACFLVAIVCANVGGVLLARGLARGKEIAIRATLGASHWRIARQLMTEALLLTFAGGLAGFLLAIWGVPALRAMAPPYTPRIDQVRLGWTVFCYVFVVTVIAGVISGLAPAFQAFRSDPNAGLKRSGGASSERTSGHHAARDILVVTEIALAVVLSIGATLTIRSFLKLTGTQLGFDTSHVLTTRVNFTNAERAELVECDVCAGMLAKTLDELRALPGVEAVAATNELPLSGRIGWVHFATEMQQLSQPLASVPAEYQTITPGYFRTLEIPILLGRDFSGEDAQGTARVAIVNKALADRYFPRGPIGGRLSSGRDSRGAPEWMTIVGEAGDTRSESPAVAPGPEVYIPVEQFKYWAAMYLVLRTRSGPSVLDGAIRERIQSIDKEAPVTALLPLNQVLSSAVAEPRVRTWLLGTFGTLGLLIATLGIYGVIGHAVSQRSHEIGVRIALGAQRREIFGRVVGRGMLLTAIGLITGIATALALTQLMRGLLFGIEPADPAAFAAAIALFGAAAFIACCIPARRATRVDPMVALRQE